MPFPKSDRVMYGDNPLDEVICELKFPQILDISATAPANFQDLVRERYPLYEKESSGGLAGQIPPDFAKLVSQFAQVANERVTHRFSTDDSSRAISLAGDFLALTDRAYVTWTQFYDGLELARSSLEEVYKPAFYSRVGLRYKNLIDKHHLGLQAEPWSELLSQDLIGPLLAAPEFRDEVRRIQTLAVIAIDEVAGGFVTLRHGVMDESGDGPPKYVIDADFFTEDREATKDVTTTLAAFNGLSGRLFRWGIKPKLRNALKPLQQD